MRIRVSKLTLGKIILIEQQLKETFLAYVLSTYDSYDTVQTYRYPLDRFLKFLADEKIKRVQDVSSGTIEQYRLSLIKDDFKSASLEVYLRTIKLFFKYLEDEGIIFDNPTTGMIIPKVIKKLQYVPTVKEMDIFLDIDVSTKERLRNKALFETAYSTGARRNELRMVDIKDLDLINEELKVMGKGKVERIVPIGRTAIYWLKKYITEARKMWIKDEDNEEALFLARRGNRISKQGIQKQVEYQRKESKTKVTMHSMRRACATHMLTNGASPMVIQELLGHSTLKHLSQYLDVSITDLKRMHTKSVVNR